MLGATKAPAPKHDGAWAFHRDALFLCPGGALGRGRGTRTVGAQVSALSNADGWRSTHGSGSADHYPEVSFGGPGARL